MTRKSKGRINYTPRPDATPESELDALVAVYKFILQCHGTRKAADVTGDRNEAKEVRAVDPEQRLPQ
ncbi:MAG: hypothetical protein M3317_11255 [Actinomycetota bacterium]|nr:hypothetical protein [Actinomycetota bacterium]